MSSYRRIALCVGVAMLVAAVPIGAAIAADSRLDLADDHIEKAIALVNNSQNPNAKDSDRPFGGHDSKVVRLLEAARGEIAEAKAYADDPKNWATTSEDPTAALAASPGPPDIGLVRALDAAGGALWGDAVFAASVIVAEDGSGNTVPAVQLDLHDAAPLPVILTVFTAPGPPDEPVCRAYFQVEVGPQGVVLRLDADAAPPEFQLPGEFEPLAGVPPSPCAEDGNG